MRRVVLSCSKAAGAMSRKFASSAGEMATSGVDALIKPANIVQASIAVAAALVGAGYALHTVDAKLLAMDERLKGHKNEVDVKVAAVTKEVDVKVAGVTKEVDAKMAGVTKELDAKMAGVSDKAKAEALMVLKDYGVSDQLNERIPFGLARVCGTTCNNPFLVVFPSSPSTVGVRRWRHGQQVIGPAHDTGVSQGQGQPGRRRPSTAHTPATTTCSGRTSYPLPFADGIVRRQR